MLLLRNSCFTLLTAAYRRDSSLTLPTSRPSCLQAKSVSGAKEESLRQSDLLGMANFAARPTATLEEMKAFVSAGGAALSSRKATKVYLTALWKMVVARDTER